MNELRQLILELDTETVLALNGYFEAAGEYRRQGDVAYIAVMAVALNRAEHPKDWQDTIQEVIAAHRQFSWTNWDNAIRDPQYPTALKFARNPLKAWDKLWLAAKDAARRVVEASVLNPVQNATFYFNPHICNPSWAKKLHLVRDIGNHRFFAAPGDPKMLWACKRAEVGMMGDLSENFSRQEFACHCGCGTDNISPVLVGGLQKLRDRAGKPVAVVSGCRCENHNRKVGGEPKSFHLADGEKEGCAADVRIEGLSLRKIYEFALKIPEFQGIGIYPENDFIHLDVRGAAARWGKVKGEYVSIEEALRYV